MPIDTNRVAQVLENVQKDLTTSSVSSVPAGAGLTRQDLQSGIIKLSDRNTPLRDRLKRKKGNGTAHSWFQRTSVNAVTPENIAYQENALGSTLTPTYAPQSATYVSLGLVGSISNFFLAAGASFDDLEAEETEATTRAVIQGEEWITLHGDATVSNTNSAYTYNGLDKQITTNAISVGGSLTLDAIEEGFQRIAANGGGMGRYVIVVSPGMYRTLMNLITNGGSVNRIVIDPEKAVLGVRPAYYMSMFGPVEIVWDYFVNPQGAFPYPYNTAGSSSTSGASTSNAYILNLDSMEMVDLQTLGKQPLYMTSADNTRFLVNEYTVLAVFNEKANALLTGLTEPTY